MPALFSVAIISCSPSPPPDITDPGQLIYLGYTDKNVHCSRCHGQEGQGGMFGPSLRGVVLKIGADSARHIIRFGKGVGEKRMEGVENRLAPQQIEQVIAFISTWTDSLADSTHAYDSN